ncbi:MAG: aspartate-semialdehyde dehydrogenase, partial [Planctomycetota bacterium]
MTTDGIPPRITVLGATGAVGLEFLRIFEQRNVDPARIRLLASSRSAGKSLRLADTDITVKDSASATYQPGEIVLLSAGSGTAKAIAPAITKADAFAIDNSSAFRMDPGVPLIVPEVNSHELASRPKLIANPNCSTIIMLVALGPLHKAFGIERIDVATYQAISGAGAAALAEFDAATAAAVAGEPTPDPVIFREPTAFNVFSHDSDTDPTTGVNVEEQKMIDETHKILDDDTIAVSPICMRVPVRRTHTEAITVLLRTPTTEAAIRELLAGSPSLAVLDDRDSNNFPTALKAA